MRLRPVRAEGAKRLEIFFCKIDFNAIFYVKLYFFFSVVNCALAFKLMRKKCLKIKSRSKNAFKAIFSLKPKKCYNLCIAMRCACVNLIVLPAMLQLWPHVPVGGGRCHERPKENDHCWTEC